MTKNKLIIVAILFVGTLFFACTKEEKPAQISDKDTQSYVNPLEWDTVSIFPGMWQSTGTDKSPENNYFDTETPGHYYDDSDTAEDLKRSMQTAIYTPTELFPSLCEFVMVEVHKCGEQYDFYQVWYMYDYATENVLCYYGGQWYIVQNYDLLVLDLACLSEGYTYDKYVRSHLSSWENDAPTFYYTRFFARNTGFDPSFYSDFVNVTPVENMTEDKAIALGRAEAEPLGYPYFLECYHDPYTDYWCIKFSNEYRGEKLVNVYLDCNGCTIQITPYPLMLK